MKLKQAIWRDQKLTDGELCFRDTTIRVKQLFDSITSGQTVPNFLHSFPTVSAEQVDTVLLSAFRLTNKRIKPKERAQHANVEK